MPEQGGIIVAEIVRYSGDLLRVVWDQYSPKETLKPVSWEAENGHEWLYWAGSRGWGINTEWQLLAEACLSLIPFTYFVEIIRGLLIKQTLFIDLATDFLALTIFAVAFVLGSIAKFRKTL
jgi:hypothetical protein